ncbi:cytochrome P450 [Nocardia sp. NPDC050630]|uniref:cytochrome P450 n=1 Tax=Nocardia sp. NPDC050630 TaxID=3364321 RepID=UPI0037ADE5F3
MSAPTSASVPRSDVDLFSEEVMEAPYEVYRALRDAGPLVYLDRIDAYAVPRYEQARQVLGDWKSFSSADIALNEAAKEFISDRGVIRADPPWHDQMRGVMAERLAPRAVRALRPEIARRADELIDRLVGKGSFDAVTELAHRFPVDIVGDLIGLPEQGRADLLPLLDANFNTFGPDNARTRTSLPVLDTLTAYVMVTVTRDVLAEGSIGRAVYEAADAGRIPAEAAPFVVLAYIAAGMDTTVHALAHAVWLFAENPDQWQALRADPALVPQALREVLRYESPVQVFGRTVRTGVTLEGIDLSAGTRLAVLYGSANRDERKWADADRFDITRANSDHLGFGYGLHGCAGQALATIEGEAVLNALLRRVTHLHAGTPVRHYNNVLRGLSALPVTVTTA